MTFRNARGLLQSSGNIGIAILFALIEAYAAQDRIGEIEFFGSKGFDPQAVRGALPIHEGGPLLKSKKKIQEAVKRAIGADPTDVAFLCCDTQGDWMIYIGLPGESSHPVAYGPEPKGSARLPKEATKLYNQTMDALMRAVMKGDDAEEEGSAGYALAKNPALHAKQVEIRKYAIAHEPLLFEVLESSADGFHREVAAHFLGYAQQSPTQIASLVRASSDPRDNVRNNAVRALGELADSSPGVAEQIDPNPFIAMISSGTWSDRNKGTFLIDNLTLSRPPDLMAQLREHSLEALLEMARWRSRGHSEAALAILGRMAGIDEKRLQDLIGKGDISEILAPFSGSKN